MTTTCHATHGRRVCWIQKNPDEPDYKAHLAELTRGMSESLLSLPILTKSQILQELQQDNTAAAALTHGLVVEDYLHGHLLLPEQDCYVVSLQPLTTTTTTATISSAAMRRNRKQQQQQASMGKNNNNNNNNKTNKTKPLKKLPKVHAFGIDLCPLYPSPRSSSGQPDLLLQAVAPQRIMPHGAHVMDLTAGWAQDSLCLAMAGASHVTMVERDPIVALLLQDALRRLNLVAQSIPPGPASSSSSPYHAWPMRALDLSQKLSLQVNEARHVLQNLMANDDNNNDNDNPIPDIIYLDPMFPPRQKTAAVKMGMQLLHGLLQDEYQEEIDTAIHDDSGRGSRNRREMEEWELLQLAYETARYKVVVKRPIHATTLGGGGGVRDNHTGKLLLPSHSVCGSINRWDIYVKK